MISPSSRRAAAACRQQPLRRLHHGQQANAMPMGAAQQHAVAGCGQILGQHPGRPRLTRSRASAAQRDAVERSIGRSPWPFEKPG
jgi:hypothetical protein